jgi:hypothetical protein
VTSERRVLWILWAAMLAWLAVALALPLRLPLPDPWNAGEAAVAIFVLSILALVAGVGSFAIRESLALRDLRSGALDPGTPAGFAQLRRALLVLWALCDAIGILGFLAAFGSASPRVALPYTAGAALLLLLHAPRAWLFERAPGLSSAGT